MATDLGFPPAHPGEVLREDVLPALGMSVKALAAHIGVSRQSLSELINERRSVSVEMALKLGKAFGNGARFWLALQMQHDLWQAEKGDDVDVQPLDWEGKDAA
jgi:antitoxin HigA-1